MTYYVVIFVLCLIFYLLYSNTKDKGSKKVIELVILVILILLSGTRYRLGGWDYNIYEDIFNSAPEINEFSFETTNRYGTEIGYILMNSVIKTIGFNFYGFTLIHSIIFYILLYKALKKFDINFSYFIIIFLYKCCIFNTFVSLRQSLVLVIFFNAVYYLTKGETKKYLVHIIPCLFLHLSSIILFPLVFIKKINFPKKGLVVYGIIFALLFVLNILGLFVFNPSNMINSFFGSNTDIMNKTDFYLSKEISVNVLSTLETFAVWFLIVILYDKIYKDANMEKKTLINIYLLIIPFVTLFRSFEIMIRFRDYFSIFLPFVLYYASRVLKNNMRLIFNFIIFIFCFIGFYRYIYTYDTGLYALKNYQSYITKDISIFREK